jgi:hypothetical protein
VVQTDAIAGGPNRLAQPFRVSINAKGGDCWHVYRQSMIVIDGKNNMVWLQARTTGRTTGLQAECACHLMENRLGRHHKSRQEERADGGQISGVRSEHGDRPSLDPGEPARSLKCKVKRAYKILKAGGPSIFGQDTWLKINISLTERSKEGGA